MAKRRPPRKRDKRTRQQKVMDIVRAVKEAGAEGIGSQRELARRTQIPQLEVSALMPEVVAASYDMCPGYRVYAANRADKSYKLLKRSRRSDIRYCAGRISKARTAFKRAGHELDVALAGVGQRMLRDEIAALATLVDGAASRAYDFVMTEEVEALVNDNGEGEPGYYN